MDLSKIKSDYILRKKEIIDNKKNKLSDPSIYKFEKEAIKYSAKSELLTLRQEFKIDLLKEKNPNKYNLYKTQKANENAIINRYQQYYDELNVYEKKLRKAKRKKISKNEKKIEIVEAKNNLNKFIEDNKTILKDDINKIKLNGGVSKKRNLKNKTFIIGNRINKKINPFLGALSNQKHLVAIRNAFSSLIPIIMIASFITVIRSIPLSTDPNSAHAYLSSYIPKKIDDGLVAINNLTLGLMALSLSFSIGVNLALLYNESPGTGGLMGFIGFILWVGISSDGTSLPLVNLGAQALFVALVSSIFMFELYRVFKKYHITIRLPKSVPPAVSNSFIAIIPGIVYAIFVISIRYALGFDLVTQMTYILKPIGSAISDNFGAVLLIVLLNSFFWWLGIHGSAITGIITYPFWYPAIAANQDWFNGGMIGPCPYTYPEPFYQWMIWIGGAGSVIGLSFASIFFSKSQQNKKMSKAVFIPSIFNISEPMMFGFPIVLNVYLFIPFMIAPVVTAISSSLLISIVGLHWVVLAPWSLPAPIGSFLASGNNWWAIIISTISIVFATLVWLPFYMAWDKSLVKEENAKNNEEAEKMGITLRELLINRELERSKKLKNK